MKANDNRYDNMIYRRCGHSGLKLPLISLGLWNNFGGFDDFNTAKEIIFTSFNEGITCFDLANNYGPPPGEAEKTFGKILGKALKAYRDEILITTKAGYPMWKGPYGDMGSRKYLLASLDQSLKRMRLEYVDIFYSHRPDKDTPISETVGALAHAVRSGKALYAGISNYSGEQTEEALKVFAQEKIPCLIHQVRYSMFSRIPESDLFPVLEKHKIGCAAFSPLAQGLLTNKYLDGIPKKSRAAKKHGTLKKENIDERVLSKIRALNEIAKNRSQSLASMALSWVLRDSRVTSALIGASSKKQIRDNITAINKTDFSQEEVSAIEEVLSEK